VTSPNIDLVRAVFRTWERGDFASADWAHSEIEFVIADGPAPDSWSGLAGMADGERYFLNTFEDLRVEARELHELDGERILVLTRATGRFKTSGMSVQDMPGRGATLFHLREGRVAKLVVYFEARRALADAGLARDL
jgi:ketosteroid isomerase-like protein